MGVVLGTASAHWYTREDSATTETTARTDEVRGENETGRLSAI